MQVRRLLFASLLFAGCCLLPSAWAPITGRASAQDEKKKTTTKVDPDDTEKAIADLKKALKATEKELEATNKALDELKTALNGNDIDAIRAAHETLMGASQAISQQLYEKAAQENAAGTSASGQTGNGSSDGDDDIIDAEIVDEQ